MDALHSAPGTSEPPPARATGHCRLPPPSRNVAVHEIGFQAFPATLSATIVLRSVT
jgi:hypothetical protein